MYEHAKWDRPVLKDYAKTSLKNFYWKAVLATLIVGLLTGGGLNSGGGSSITYNLESGETFYESLPFHDPSASALVGFVVLVVVLIAMVLAVLYSTFIGNPLVVGHHRFYMESRFQPTNLDQLFHGFTGGNYINVVKTMFLRDLYIFLWSLLFVIPGIVKSYEYRMVPYILAENPNISSERALELSREMMNGRKWDLFVFDLSFFGWNMLASIIVIGHIFLNPYIHAAETEVYLWLRYDALHHGYAQPVELDGMFIRAQ
ncbi:MAG: DUF975 family protein [Oscillospiraceae bacterium]|nr:DUF975 family protein [Oscillospiraceae bacterium]